MKNCTSDKILNNKRYIKKQKIRCRVKIVFLNRYSRN